MMGQAVLVFGPKELRDQTRRTSWKRGMWNRFAKKGRNEATQEKEEERGGD